MPGADKQKRWPRALDGVIIEKFDAAQGNRAGAAAPLFNIFSIPLISGDPSTALEQPYTLIISKDIADNYFSNQDPIGKIVNINEDDYTITGIAENAPENTHFKFSILVSIKTIENDDSMFAWNQFNFHYHNISIYGKFFIGK